MTWFWITLLWIRFTPYFDILKQTPHTVLFLLLLSFLTCTQTISPHTSGSIPEPLTKNLSRRSGFHRRQSFSGARPFQQMISALLSDIRIPAFSSSCSVKNMGVRLWSIEIEPILLIQHILTKNMILMSPCLHVVLLSIRKDNLCFYRCF